MLDVGIVTKVYERLYQQVYNQPNFVFNCTEQRSKTINKFLHTIPFTAGKNWLNDYLLYQFYRFNYKKTRFKAIKNINWVFGNKAYQIWSARTPEQLYYCQEWKYKFNIRIDKNLIFRCKTNYENVEKRRFYNTLRGYIHCNMLDFSYSSTKDCFLCKNKHLCSVN